MKTKNIDARALQDITIGELPKQDNPNNSDLLVIQGSSLTEATTIQQLRNKILSGGDNVNGGLGTYLFSPIPIADTSYLLMDGTKYFKNSYQDFYLFLQNQSQNAKTLFKLDEVEESFILPDYTNLGMKITKTTPASTTSTAGVAEHKHKIAGFGKRTGFWMNQQTGTQPSSARSVLVEEISGDQNVDRPYTGSPLDTIYNTALSTIRYPSFPAFCYIKVLNQNSNIVATPFIKSDGSVSMNADYTPTDIQDVATKRYIDNKFLNYELPLSFSINDIGKVIPYYHKADTNPTLIALDGTKYLISDYPDFDYENIIDPVGVTLFANDGIYFWLDKITIKLKHQTASTGFSNEALGYRPMYGGSSTIISKLIYNWLMKPENASFLGNESDKFKIIDPDIFRITLPQYSGDNSILTAGATFLNQSTIDTSGTTTVRSLKSLPTLIQVKPDYMVAKIQQVGGGASGSGDLKSDRSILLTGTGTFNTKQIASMDDLKDTNIIVTDSARVITTLKTKLDTIDTSISNGSNDISALQTLVNDLKTKLDSYDTKYRSFTSKFVKSGLNVTINSNVNILTNLTKYFIASQNPTITAFGSSISGLPLGAINLIEVGSGANQGFRFPVINGIINCNLTFTIRVTGDISGSAGTPRELIVYLRRVSDNSLVANGGIIKVNDNNFNARSVIVPSFIQGANDPFYTGGFYLDLLNKSGGNLTLTSIELLIQG